MIQCLSKHVLWIASLLPVFLAACADNLLQPEAPLYRCEAGVGFTARFADDTAILNGPHGYEVLYRNAGGTGLAQTVYTNARMRAEFGRGPAGREALLRYFLVPLVVRCVIDQRYSAQR